MTPAVSLQVVDHSARTMDAQVHKEELEVVWVEEGYYRHWGDGFLVRFCTLFPLLLLTSTFSPFLSVALKPSITRSLSPRRIWEPTPPTPSLAWLVSIHRPRAISQRPPKRRGLTRRKRVAYNRQKNFSTRRFGFMECSGCIRPWWRKF